MKEWRPLGEKQQLLNRRLTPGEKAFVFGCASLHEGILVAKTYHDFTHERPADGLIDMVGAGIIVLAMVYRANKLVKKVNNLEDQIAKLTQKNY